MAPQRRSEVRLSESKNARNGQQGLEKMASQPKLADRYILPCKVQRHIVKSVISKVTMSENKK